MRTTRWLVLSLVVSLVAACAGTDNNTTNKAQCGDGIDNDGDGLIDFPDDPGCISLTDTSENSLPSPQCSDGRDNDNDGKIDFPFDPGCFSPNQDSETDDCPNGPMCPQCSNGKDDDNNGVTDYPNDPGCLSAADTVEFTDNPAACGSNVVIHQLPPDGHVMGMLDTARASALISPTCGGGGAEDVYELLISSPKVVVATTDNSGTMADTVLYLRSADCVNNASELTCNDDVTGAMVAGTSTITFSLSTPGAYYLVVDAHDSGAGGAYELKVDLLAGEGELCDPNVNSCGTGLVCRTPLGGTMNVCSKPECSDGVDDDGDGKNDYPDDPGCTSPADNDETDTCPGAGCPQCADGIDNDGDGKIDYPNDPNCASASGLSESCVDTDPVTDIVATTTSGTTVGLHNDSSQACGSSSTTTAPDKSYRIHVTMKLDSLNITTTPSFDAVTAAYGPSCGGTALSCQDSSPIALTNLDAGDVYVVVDGYSTGSGTFTLGVNGVIKNGESCEGPLVTNGVLACSASAACTGTAGMRTCVPAQCSDGLDNNNDGKIDYPADPGCTSPSDNTETTVCPGVNCPVCADGTDNDMDGHIDYATDLSCWAASGTNEAFCDSVAETDRAILISSGTTTGTTTGLHNDIASETCQSSAGGNDAAFSLTLPVPVTTITFDTNGSAFDTVLSLRNSTCATEIQCDDDGGNFPQSKITRTNLAAGNYAVIVDGYSMGSGVYQLNVKGTVAAGQPCTSPLFASGVLACAGTCNGTTCQ